MAWANATLIGWLGTLSDDDLAATAPMNEWSAGRILDHLVNAAGNYVMRLDGASRITPPDPLTTIAELPERAGRLAGFDARLRAHAAQPEGRAAYAGDDRTFARSTVLDQAIHHATEHRAQIAGALATNGINAVDLDAIDVWAYGEAEGLGD
jgi:uncharacterized damage-inducible protein DinB